ncbi:MAG: alpha/beta hydrolase family protein, partial [Ruthenibacterium sp.]
DDDLAPDSTPWNAPELLWKESAMPYLSGCKTPTLFLHSTEDHTCCVEQTKEIFAALTLLGVPARACLFKGENHELSRSGKPRHRVRRLKELVQWMDAWLKPQDGPAAAE